MSFPCIAHFTNSLFYFIIYPHRRSFKKANQKNACLKYFLRNLFLFYQETRLETLSHILKYILTDVASNYEFIISRTSFYPDSNYLAIISDIVKVLKKNYYHYLESI